MMYLCTLPLSVRGYFWLFFCIIVFLNFSMQKDRDSPQSLAQLLQLASDVKKERKEGSFRHAVRMARETCWFMLM